MLKTNIKVLLLAIFVVGIAAAIIIAYLAGPSFQLVREAEGLYEQGDLGGAHTKTKEALVIDQYNRRAITLQAKYFFELSNYNALTNGTLAMKNADTAVLNHDYIQASDLYNEAYRAFAGVGRCPSTKGLYDCDAINNDYSKARNGMEESILKEQNIDAQIAEQYYSNAMRMYRRGELAAAFEYLLIAPADSPDITNLKSDIGYTLGLERYNEIASNPSHFPATYKNDAIYWLRQVHKTDKNYNNTLLLIMELEKMPAAQ
jgi:hypothetical protein